MFLGSEEKHAFMRHGAEEITHILPKARHLILEGQDHGPAEDVLAATLKELFITELAKLAEIPTD